MKHINWKKVVKKALPYVIALIIGIMIMILVTPGAKARRDDPSLVGGEILIPVLAVGGTFVVKAVYMDIKSGTFRTDDEEDDI